MDTRRRILAATLTFASVLAASRAVRADDSAALGLNASTSNEVLTYVSRHRDDVGLVAYEVGPDGGPLAGGLFLSHLGSEAMPLGSTFKIVTLAAYARAAAAGDLDPGEEVTVSDWEAFYLPGTDGDAHRSALTALGIPSDDLGFALDPTVRVTLDDLAAAMIRASDNAATDYLRERLGAPALASTLAALDIERHGLPRSVLGTFLSWENHADGGLDKERLEALLQQSPDAYSAEVERLAELYTTDPSWRDAELAWRADGGPVLAPFSERTAAHHLFVQGSAGTYARLMAGILAGTLFPEVENAILRRHLEWPMTNPGIAESFNAFGTKGGSLVGVLTEATYYEPRVGPYAGHRFVCVLFLREMPLLSWLKLSASGATQLFQLQIVVDPEFAARVARVLSR